MKNLFVSASLIAAALFTLPAQAVTVTFDYTNTNLGGDNSGKTSPLLGANNVPVAGSNLFVETFGAVNGGGNDQGCGLDTPAGLIKITGGTYGFRKGTLSGIAAAPAGDSTRFAYGPGAGQTSSTVNIDYTGLLAGLGANASLNYLGLYYGSIDTYNDLIFYNAAHEVIRTVTGTELIAQFAGQSGNQNADSSNIYVNLFFSPAEQFTSFSFRTTGIAFEMDNLAVGFNIAPPTGVPEPASIALLGLGLAALGVTRRRKSAV